MINHVTLSVSNFEVSKKFYTCALEPLGYRLLKNGATVAGFGVEDIEGKRDFWIKERKDNVEAHDLSCLAFTAAKKESVNDFYQAAIQSGGRDNGAPGYHTEYSPGYYAAFVFDPDGNNIEAVFDDGSVERSEI